MSAKTIADKLNGVHPDTIADRVVAAALHGTITDPRDIYSAARKAYRTFTGSTKAQARAAIRRAVVRAALKAESVEVRTKGMAVHTRR